MYSDDLVVEKSSKGVYFKSGDGDVLVNLLSEETDLGSVELYIGKGEDAVPLGYDTLLDVVFLGPKEDAIRYVAFLDLDLLDFVGNNLGYPMVDNRVTLFEKDLIVFLERNSVDKQLSMISSESVEKDGFQTLVLKVHLKEPEHEVEVETTEPEPSDIGNTE